MSDRSRKYIAFADEKFFLAGWRLKPPTLRRVSGSPDVLNRSKLGLPGGDN